MAIWDAKGKELNKPLYKLLGGKSHEEISYFGFAQGENAFEIATDAKKLANHLKFLPCKLNICLLYTSPSPRDRTRSRMPSSA